MFGLAACGLAYILGKDSKRKGQTIKKQASDLEKASETNKKLDFINNQVVEENKKQKAENGDLRRENNILASKLKEVQEKKPEA